MEGMIVHAAKGRATSRASRMKPRVVIRKNDLPQAEWMWCVDGKEILFPVRDHYQGLRPLEEVIKRALGMDFSAREYYTRKKMLDAPQVLK
jgi:hypothetical protein